MFLLGHMIIGYLIARPVSSLVKQKIHPYLLLLAGAIPDFDVLFPSLIRHHTITHSIVYWIPVLTALAIIIHKRATPVAVGIVQHFLVGDFLVGTIPILLPFSDIQVGLKLGMPSTFDTVTELSVLAGAFIYGRMNGDAHRILMKKKENIMTIIPLLTLVGLSAFVTGETEFLPLVTYGFSRKALSAITLGHATLAAVMAISVVQGLRSLRRN